ncbi:MAG TPA: TrkH family potassium uptake protein, partial [Paracoccaceae bacterium]
LFAISIAIVNGALGLAGIGFDAGIVLSIAALTTTGPLAAVATETPISYAELGASAKVILGLAMILGRMETLALVALLAPDSWRRR